MKVTFDMEATVRLAVVKHLTNTLFEMEVSTELLKFKCPILVKPNHISKDAPCVLGTVEKFNGPVK